MKLEQRNRCFQEYISELTKMLDDVSGISACENYGMFRHYILANNWYREESCLPIRVPGGTIGSIWLNDIDVITKIAVDTNYVVKTYPKNVNDLIQKFVGEIIEWQ